MLWYSLNLFVIFILVLLFLVVRSTNKYWQKTDLFIEDAANIVESIRSGNLSKKIGKINSTSGEALADSINQLIDTLKESEKKVREQQTELMRQNRFLESVLNSLSDGLIIVDKNSKIIKVTPKIANWFGQSNKKLIGQDVFDFIEPINQAPIENLHNTDVYIKTYSSDLFEATALRLNIEDRISRYIILIKNVTNQKALEKLNQLKNVELRMFCTDNETGGFHTKGYIFRREEIYRIIKGVIAIVQEIEQKGGGEK